jgi:hypothetical protein
MQNHPPEVNRWSDTKKKMEFDWIGHILCKDTGAIEKTALDWNAQGYRRRGMLKRMW